MLDVLGTGADGGELIVVQRRDNGLLRCVGATEPAEEKRLYARGGEAALGEEALRSLAAAKPRPETTELLETGIKVIDLLSPMVAGGTVGFFGSSGVGRAALLQERRSRNCCGTRTIQCKR